MVINFYQAVKGYRDEKRNQLEKVAPEPRNLKGFFLPRVLESRPKEEIGRRAVRTLSRHGIGSVVITAEQIGWEKLINLIEEKQGPYVTGAGKAMRKEFNVTGDTLVDCRIISAAGAAGCGFERHQMIEFTGTHMEGVGDWCGLVQAASELGMGDKIEKLSIWCDAYDNFEVHATNPNLWYVHAFCLGRGDRYCRYYVDLYKDTEGEGESYYHTLERHIQEKREEIEKTSPEPSSLQGYGLPRTLEDLSKEDIFKRAVKIWNHICVASMSIAAEALGWEKFLNLVGEKMGPGFTDAAVAMKRDFNITGHTLRDASRMFSIASSACGFDKHQIIDYSDKRIEGVAEWCPLVDSAKDLGMKDKIGEMSFWCDVYHNFDIHAVSPKFQQVYTHCLGRGDKYCRFVIEEVR
jgi:hypothetical protein